MSDLARRASPARTPADARPAPRRARRAGRRRDGLLDVAYRTVDSPLGPLLLAATPAGLVRVAFDGEGHDAVLGAPGRRRQPADPARAGPPRRRGPPARRVLRRPPPRVRRPRRPAARPRVPPRRARPPARRSRTARPRATPPSPGPPGRPTPCAPPARACATNPVPLVVPCHRVVRSDGSIGQYRGGVEAKRAAARPGGGVTGVDRRSTGRRVAATLDDARLRRRRARSSTPTACRDARRRSTTTTTASARRSTWPATASAQGEYRYFAHPLPDRRRPSCGRRSGRTCCRSPGTGRRAPGARRRGPTTSTTGSPCATTPASAARRRCCCATARATGTPCTATSTASSCSRCRSWSASTSPASTTTAASSSSSSSGRGRSRGRRRRLIGRGEALVFTTRDRPVRSARGLGGGADAPRRQRRALRPPPHPRPRLPRRRLTRPIRVLRQPSVRAGPSAHDTRMDRRQRAASTRRASCSRRAASERAWRGIDAHGSPRSARRVGMVGDRPAVGAERRGRRARPTRAAWPPARRPRGRTEYGDTAVWA